MFFSAGLFLLVLTVSQVSATSLLQKRSLEFLEVRQTTCTVDCNAFSDTVSACKTMTCICNSAVAAMLQTCITCAVTSAPTPSVMQSAQSLIDTYDQTCAGVAGVPAVTIPGGTGATASPATLATSRSVSVGLPSSTPVNHVTVTNGTPSPAIVQSTFTGGTSTDNSLPTATGNVPGGVVKSGGTRRYDAKQAGFVVLGAMVGAAMVL